MSPLHPRDYVGIEYFVTARIINSNASLEEVNTNYQKVKNEERNLARIISELKEMIQDNRFTIADIEQTWPQIISEIELSNELMQKSLKVLKDNTIEITRIMKSLDREDAISQMTYYCEQEFKTEQEQQLVLDITVR